jgi:hypothetical protein
VTTRIRYFTRVDVEIKRGDGLAFCTFHFTDLTDGSDVDISGDEFAAQVRKFEDDADVLATCTCSFTTDGTDGRGQVAIASVVSTDLPAGSWKWDLEWIIGGGGNDPVTPLGGDFIVLKDVTR